MNIELDLEKQVRALIAQRNQLLSEASQLRLRVMDLEVIVNNLVDDADE